MQLTRNFHSIEFASKDGAPTPEKYMGNLRRLAAQLQVLRDYLGEPVRITSGYRSPAHNRKVGGAKNSMHLYGKAADISVKSKSPKELKDIVEKLIKEKKLAFGGIGLYSGWLHVDIRKEAVRW